MKKKVAINKNKSIAIWPDSFIGDDNKSFIKKSAALLPVDTLYCLEIHPSTKVDLLFCIPPASKDLFIDFRPDHKQTIKALLAKWSSDAFLIDHIRNIWITLDYVKDARPDPWPYVLMHQIQLGKEIQKLVLKKIIQSVWYKPLPLQTVWIEQAIDKLPSNSYVFGVSAHVRNDYSIRLILGNIKPEEMVSYLLNLHWQGPLLLLTEIVAVLDHRLWYSLLLDFKDTISPVAGIEVWFDPARSKSQALSLMQSLVNKKLIPEADNIATMIDSIIITENQWVNHIKIQIINQRALEIKTYLFKNACI